MCPEHGAPRLVPDYTLTGFDISPNRLVESHARLKDLLALRLSVCVGASYNPATNQICFSVPIYEDLCVTSPVPIPVGASLKACAETCGGLIPSGLKVTIYLNGNPIFNGTVVGHC
jgi:hypothetical protein